MRLGPHSGEAKLGNGGGDGSQESSVSASLLDRITALEARLAASGTADIAHGGEGQAALKDASSTGALSSVIQDGVANLARRCAAAEADVRRYREEAEERRIAVRSMEEASERAATEAEAAMRRAAAFRIELSESLRKCSRLEEELSSRPVSASDAGQEEQIAVDEDAAR